MPRTSHGPQFLQKYGNSLCLIIPQPILRLLGITKKTSLELKTDGFTLTIVPGEEVHTLRAKELAIEKHLTSSFEQFGYIYKDLL